MRRHPLLLLATASVATATIWAIFVVLVVR